MADVKISGLPASTTPLAGTEVLPIVQSGATKKVAVSDLTAGRTVAMAALGVGTSATAQRLVNIASSAGVSPLAAVGPNAYVLIDNVGAGSSYYQSAAEHVFSTGAGTTTALQLDSNQNVNVVTGNLVIGTSGKGIDFSATAGTGTSELLADYEEGTWTPIQGAGLTVTGTFVSSGTYTKIGRQVMIRGTVSATSVSASASTTIVGGLPFTVSGDTPGTFFNGAASTGGVLDVYATSVLTTVAIGSTTALFFSAVYMV